MKKIYLVTILILLVMSFSVVNVFAKTYVEINGDKSHSTVNVEINGNNSQKHVKVDNEENTEINGNNSQKHVKADNEENTEDKDNRNERSLVRIFGTGNVETGEVTDDVVLIFSDGTVRGKVTKDCVVIGGNVHLKHNAEIDGDLVTIFSSIDKDRHVIVKGDTVNIASYEVSTFPSLITGLFTEWDILLAFILLLISWKYINILTDTFSTNPALSFITGFLGIISFIFIIILLVISIVGILLIPVVPILYFIGFALGFAVLGNILGEKFEHITGHEMKQPLRAIVGLIVILVIFKLVGFFPLLGGLTVTLIKMVIRTFGLGLLIITMWRLAGRK